MDLLLLLYVVVVAALCCVLGLVGVGIWKLLVKGDEDDGELGCKIPPEYVAVATGLTGFSAANSEKKSFFACCTAAAGAVGLCNGCDCGAEANAAMGTRLSA